MNFKRSQYKPMARWNTRLNFRGYNITNTSSMSIFSQIMWASANSSWLNQRDFRLWDNPMLARDSHIKRPRRWWGVWRGH